MPKKRRFAACDRKYPPNIQSVARSLKRRYKDFDHHNLNNPLDELLFILCSTKTSGEPIPYRETFRALKKGFRLTDDKLASSSTSAIARSISQAASANKKARAIKTLMRRTTVEFGQDLAPRREALEMEQCGMLNAPALVCPKSARR